jgi:hypothetical protein
MTFEYVLVNANLADRKPADLERELNDLGADRWELAVAFGLHNQTFVFQRELLPAPKTKSKAPK